jgi:hypothetical protein
VSRRIWAGRLLSGLAVLFLLFDAVSHFVKPAPVAEAFARLGFPLELGPALAVIVLVCTVFYVVPQTGALGAILLTGYLGGAVATHFRVRDPLFDTVFPVIFGVLAWAGLYLRDARLRQLIPIQIQSNPRSKS